MFDHKRRFAAGASSLLLALAWTGPVQAGNGASVPPVSVPGKASGASGVPAREKAGIGQAPAAPSPSAPSAERKREFAEAAGGIHLPTVIGLAALITALGAALAALWITPRTMRAIAKEQADINRAGVAVSEQNAGAAGRSAAAAARSAEAAATNAANVGIHEVARLRQEWINTLRDELASLHSDFMNWVPLRPGAGGEARDAYNARVRATNARLAKVRLLLNPREVASRRLLGVMHRLNGGRLTLRERFLLCRWLIRWSQIVLKTEWDRVRDELHGRTSPRPARRGDRR